MIRASVQGVFEIGVVGVSWVSNEETNVCGETDWERLEDVIGCLAEECAELCLICRVEEEVSETVIGVHDGCDWAAC